MQTLQPSALRRLSPRALKFGMSKRKAKRFVNAIHTSNRRAPKVSYTLAQQAATVRKLQVVLPVTA